jgi:hypothetical protein
MTTTTTKGSAMKNTPYLYHIIRGKRHHETLEFWEVEFYTNKHMTRKQIGAYAVGLLRKIGIQASVDYDVSHGSDLHHIVPVTSTGELKGDKWTFYCKVIAATPKQAAE